MSKDGDQADPRRPPRRLPPLPDARTTAHADMRYELASRRTAPQGHAAPPASSSSSSTLLIPPEPDDDDPGSLTHRIMGTPPRRRRSRVRTGDRARVLQWREGVVCERLRDLSSALPDQWDPIRRRSALPVSRQVIRRPTRPNTFVVICELVWAHEILPYMQLFDLLLGPRQASRDFRRLADVSMCDRQEVSATKINQILYYFFPSQDFLMGMVTNGVFNFYEHIRVSVLLVKWCTLRVVGYSRVVEWIIARARKRSTDKDGRPVKVPTIPIRVYMQCVRMAMLEGQVDIVRAYMEDGRLPIHDFARACLRYGTRYGQVEIVKLGLLRGADPMVEDGQYILDAIDLNRVDILDVFLKHPNADLRAKGNEGIFLAALRGFPECLKLLLAHKTVRPEQYGIHPLFAAAKYNRAKIISILLKSRKVEVVPLMARKILVIASENASGAAMLELLRDDRFVIKGINFLREAYRRWVKNVTYSVKMLGAQKVLSLLKREESIPFEEQLDPRAYRCILRQKGYDLAQKNNWVLKFLAGKGESQDVEWLLKEHGDEVDPKVDFFEPLRRAAVNGFPMACLALMKDTRVNAACEDNKILREVLAHKTMVQSTRLRVVRQLIRERRVVYSPTWAEAVALVRRKGWKRMERLMIEAPKRSDWWQGRKEKEGEADHSHHTPQMILAASPPRLPALQTPSEMSLELGFSDFSMMLEDSYVDLMDHERGVRVAAPMLADLSLFCESNLYTGGEAPEEDSDLDDLGDYSLCTGAFEGGITEMSMLNFFGNIRVDTPATPRTPRTPDPDPPLPRGDAEFLGDEDPDRGM